MCMYETQTRLRVALVLVECGLPSDVVRKIMDMIPSSPSCGQRAYDLFTQDDCQRMGLRAKQWDHESCHHTLYRTTIKTYWRITPFNAVSVSYTAYYKLSIVPQTNGEDGQEGYEPIVDVVLTDPFWGKWAVLQSVESEFEVNNETQ